MMKVLLTKKKTKQVKAEIIDNEVEKELKTTSKSKSPKAKNKPLSILKE